MVIERNLIDIVFLISIISDIKRMISLNSFDSTFESDIDKFCSDSEICRKDV
jgi:hypothetical protein